MSIRRTIKFSQVRHRTSTKSWKGSLKGVPCFIIGNGPSLNDEDISVLHPYFTIGINRSFYKIDTTILMWQDLELWYTERKKIIPLAAIKFCRNIADPQNRFFHFKLQNGNYKLPISPHHLFGRGSTGPLAVQFAYILGCSPIILLGYDCECRDKNTDFYGKNPHHKDYTLTNCKKGLRWIRKDVSKETKVISCSDSSEFKKENLSDIIGKISKKHKQSRSYWINCLM